ncbi:MAG: FecR family protein [Candidatus Pedobacter colombiensis]|uniref:FecR family protein n=1 Tax=Candidatus Pedobacter colombiensis TaxID=3121371 RepID=A0AAJ5WBU6_9SPHI|nr:FecR family protein [Pedobacter sp.]WEK21594.1 MAG: FecR family protein [Pedobacter sp.]
MNYSNVIGYELKKQDINNRNFEKIWDELPIKGSLDPMRKERIWQHIDLQTTPVRKVGYKWLSAAAVLILAASALVFYYKTDRSNYLQVVAYETSKTILLKDGTEIILGQHSKLKYPFEFGWFNRDVILDGNAVFKVKHNGQSFTVNSGGFKTKVLGTFFKVEMSGGNTAGKVSLFEGKVEVSYNDSKKTILKPGDQWSYNIREDLPHLYHHGSLSAKSLQLNFKNTALTEVLRQLSVIYGIKVSIGGMVNQKMKITGTFYYSTPEQSLEEMGYPFGLSIKKINEHHYEIK